MNMHGTQRIAAPRARVFAALNDAEILRRSIPGCEAIEKISDTDMNARIVVRVGPVKANFSGKVKLSDLDPPREYRIQGEGSSGAAGYARGGARVHLDEDGAAATILTYDVDADVGGKIAQLGGRMIDGAAKKLADEFFVNFSTNVGGAAGVVPAPPPRQAWFASLWAWLRRIFGVDRTRRDG
jgi:uncharacterized protein